MKRGRNKTKLTVVRASFNALDNGAAISRIYAPVERLFQRSGVDADSIVQISSVNWNLHH